MATSYYLKAILGGASQSGKTTFIRNKNITKEEKNFLGVDLRKIECFLNQEDYCKIIFWEFQAEEKKRKWHTMFTKGARFAVLCFDVADRTSFEDLPYWLDLIRNGSTPSIPIILVANKIDKEWNVSQEEIDAFLRDHEIDHIYFNSIEEEDQRPKLLTEVFHALNLYPEAENLTLISDGSPKILEKFIKFFEICPICHRKNHTDYLKNFFFNSSPKTVQLKKMLLNLIDKHQIYTRLYRQNLVIGIPCCECFEDFFGEKPSF